MIYKSQKAVIKLFNDYSSIAPEAKCKTIQGKRISSMSARIGCGKVSDHSNLKILSPKQMIQRLPTALAQVKAGSASENLLNETRQNIYSLYWVKEITKKVYNSIMNSINL